jgi:GR25 family glycosyltransferase involved in LPS biosynthesis
MEKNDDIIIIKWSNGITHYFIENNNIYKQFIFGDFDIEYYKSQTTDKICWNNCFKHWLIHGRKKNILYNKNNEIVIYIEKIETYIFNKIYDELKNKYCIVNKINKNKKYIIFGKINSHIKNSIIISNEYTYFNDDCCYILDDIGKYINKKNIFYIKDNHISSVLCSLNLLSIYNVNILLNKDIINVINLSYSIERYNTFIKNNNYKNINFIPAIKYDPLFLGCVLSNKLLIYNAIKQNLNYIQICEDDVIINDYDIILKSINYLNKHRKWNLLSCFNVNIDDSYKIYEIIHLSNKYKLLKVNKWCSTVFNIYNSNCFDNIMNYDEKKINLNDFDENGNLMWTIDRKIKFKEIYLIYPYPVDIININSEIWNNDVYYNYIQMKNKGYKLLDSIIKNSNNYDDEM